MGVDASSIATRVVFAFVHVDLARVAREPRVTLAPKGT